MTDRIIIGIDPGLDGGVVILIPGVVNPQKWVVPNFEREVKRYGKKTARREHDLPALRRILAGYEPSLIFPVIPHAFVEKQQSMNKPIVQRCGRCQAVVSKTTPQSPVATFSHGRGYGQIEGILVGLGIPYELVHAKSWQSEMFKGLPRADTKAQSKLMAGRLWPTMDLRANERCRTPHDGICDALMIAEYGNRILRGQATLPEQEDDEVPF